MDPIELQKLAEQLQAMYPGMSTSQIYNILGSGNPNMNINTVGSGIEPLGSEVDSSDPTSTSGINITAEDIAFEKYLDEGYSSEEAFQLAKRDTATGTDNNTEQNQYAPLMNNPLLYTGGFDMETQAAQLGRFIGQNQGTGGRGLGIASAAGGLGLGITREVLSGIGAAKQNQRVLDRNNELQQRRTYTPAPQSAATNTTGGNVFGKGGYKDKYGKGGEYDHLMKYFADGGVSGEPTPQQLNTWRSTDFRSGNTTIQNPESFSLVTGQTDLEAYFNKFPSERKSVIEEGRRVWYDPNRELYVASEAGDPSLYSDFRLPEAPAPKDPAMRDANTGVILEGRPVAEGQNIDRQYSQYLEQAVNDPRSIAERRSVESEMAENNRLSKLMSKKDIADMKAKGLTPMQYVKIKEEQGRDYSSLFQ